MPDKDVQVPTGHSAGWARTPCTDDDETHDAIQLKTKGPTLVDTHTLNTRPTGGDVED